MKLELNRWIIVSLAIAETLVWAAYVYVFPALLLTWEADLGWSRPELALAFTVALATSALLAPWMGRLIDKGLGPFAFSGATLIGGIGLLVHAQITQLWQFYLVWVVLGVAMAGSLYEPCFALLTRCVGQNARAAITRITLVAGFAGTVSFPSAHVLTENFGWRTTMIIFGLIVIFIAMPLIWHASRTLESNRHPDPPKTMHAAPTSARSLMTSPVFILLTLGFTLAGINHNALVSHLLPIMEWRGLSAGEAVFAAALMGPMQVFGRLVMMALENRTSMLAIGFYSFLGLGLASLAMLIASSELIFLVFLFILLQGASHGVTSITRPVITAQLLGVRNFGLVSGMMALPYGLGFAAAPFVSAYLWKIGTYHMVLSFTMVLALVAFVALVLASRSSNANDGKDA